MKSRFDLAFPSYDGMGARERVPSVTLAHPVIRALKIPITLYEYRVSDDPMCRGQMADPMGKTLSFLPDW